VGRLVETRAVLRGLTFSLGPHPGLPRLVRSTWPIPAYGLGYEVCQPVMMTTRVWCDRCLDAGCWFLSLLPRTLIHVILRVTCANQHHEVTAMKKFGLYLAGALLTLVASVLAALVASAIYVRVYAFREGVPLHTLSEDYGLAFEMVFVALATLVIGLVLGSWLTHRSISSTK